MARSNLVSKSGKLNWDLKGLECSRSYDLTIAAGRLDNGQVVWGSRTAAIASPRACPNLLNARVAQTVDSIGVAATITTSSPSLNWAIGEFSYMRVVAARDDSPHRFGEIGWYKGSWLVGPNVKVVGIYKGADGRVVRKAGPTIVNSSRFTYKLVNDETCDGQPATKDMNWDLCYGSTKLVTANLGFTVAKRFTSGGEVGTVINTQIHQIPMGPSTITNNQYKSTGGNWVSTSSVYCIDAYPHTPPSNGVCKSDVSEKYSVTGVFPPDTNWTVSSSTSQASGASGASSGSNEVSLPTGRADMADALRIASHVSTARNFRVDGTTFRETNLGAYMSEELEPVRKILVITSRGEGVDEYGVRHTTLELAIDKATSEIVVLTTY